MLQISRGLLIVCSLALAGFVLAALYAGVRGSW